MTTIIGTVRRVTFQIPASIVVSAPTAYKVSIAGTTSAGAAFVSGNTSALTVNPPASISSLAPFSGQPGQSFSVTIAGHYTNFVQGVTRADFGPGISVGGAQEGQFGPVTVENPTRLTAQIAIDPSESAGIHTLTVITGAQQKLASSGFAVVTKQTATTGADGTASFASANLTVDVTDITSQQLLSGMTVVLLQDGTSEGIVVSDPSGNYTPDIFTVSDPPAPSSNTLGLDPTFVTVSIGSTTVPAGLIPTAFLNVTNSGTTYQLPADLWQQVIPPQKASQCVITTVANVEQVLNQELQSAANSALHPHSSTVDLGQLNPDEALSGTNASGSFLSFVVTDVLSNFSLPAFSLGVELHWALAGYKGNCNLQICPLPSSSVLSQLASVDFSVSPAPTQPQGCPVPPVASSPFASSSIVVNDAGTGLGVPSSAVDANGTFPQGGFLTNAAGDFTISKLHSAPYDITASKSGYVPNGVIANVQAGQQNQSVVGLAPFQGSSQPFITSVTSILARDSQGIIIVGRGFGSTPPQTVPVGDGSVDTFGCNVSTPSLAIHDNGVGADAWAAGRENCTNFNAIGITIQSWSDTQIVLNGFGSALGNATNPSSFNISSRDPLTVLVFGPSNSGIATYNLQVSSPTPFPLNGSTTVQIPANQVFTDTGISLNAGDNVTISASGLITLTTDGHIPPMSPAGFPPNCTAAEVYGQFFAPFPAFQLPCWSLIGRISSNGQIFEVGTGTSFQAQTGGELYLGVNDNNLGDNSGNWTAMVTVVP